MLYRTLKRMIERGQVEGMAEKLDVFFAVGKLSRAEYDELMDMEKITGGGRLKSSIRVTLTPGAEVHIYG